jgi:pyruvate dehydrogenase kinase 2/3/4
MREPSAPASQGVTMRLRYKQMNLKNREVTERKQVGDAESMVNEGSSASGISGFFGKEGEV